MAKNKTFVKIQRGHRSKGARVKKFLEYVLDRENNPWYVPSNLPAPSFLDRLNQLSMRQAKDEAAEAKLSGQEAKAAADKAAAEAFQLHQFGRFLLSLFGGPLPFICRLPTLGPISFVPALLAGLPLPPQTVLVMSGVQSTGPAG